MEAFRSRKDRTLAITFGTQEMPPSDTGELTAMNQEFVWIAVKKDQFTAAEINAIEKADLDFPERKSQSQRIRAVLYKWWEQDNNGMTFDAFYRYYTDKYIDHIKNKLES